MDGVANAAVSHVHADVDGGGLLFERREVGGQRQRGAAVLPSYNGSDALRDDGERLGMRVEAVVGVGVRVDEAGGEDEAAGVDDTIGARGLEVATAAMRPPSTRTAARRPGEPVPSMTVAFVMRTAGCTGVAPD
jgi:hypothetical protein